jgi:predicted nucleotidyltransferase
LFVPCTLCVLRCFTIINKGEEGFLSSILDVKVDLVMKDALKPRIKENILREAVPV